jgi:uncharacterized protein YggU (UPF0235/DUF167 family)
VEARQGLRDGVNVDGRGKKNQIVVHSHADEIKVAELDMGTKGKADAGIGHQDLVDGS